MAFRISVFLLFLQITYAQAQKYSLQILTQGKNTNLRGLSIADKNFIRVSGNNGMTGISEDGGVSWKWQQVKGFEQKDFRDVHAFDKNNALLMSIDTPAYILKTTNGGNDWKTVYKNATQGMFLNAMSFNGNKGIVVGDPVNGKIFLATTEDGGNSWNSLSVSISDKINNGEAFFASSGSNIVFTQNSNFYLVSGGTKSRLFTRNAVYNIPIMQGKETTGANAVAVYKNHIAVCGGDFMQPDRNDSCFCFSNDGGRTWLVPSVPPGGYRSDIIFVNEKILFCCGLNGIDVSKDGGNIWQSISKLPFNTCRYSKSLNAVFFAGPKGCIAKLQL